MKKQATFFVLIIATILGGCNNHPTSPTILNKIEGLMQSQPDSAYSLLSTINTDTLNAESLAHWYLLKAELSHRAANVPLPSSTDMEMTFNLYRKYKKKEKALKSEFYLGMAYAAEGETNKAMDTYTHVYQKAEENNDYQLMGYVCSYTADLYSINEFASESLKKRKEAALLFKKAQNQRSYVCALRDICRNYAYMDSLSKALTYLQKADSIGKTLNDKNVYASLLNAYGNIYAMKHKYEKAESYFHQALAISQDSISDYWALIDLYFQMQSYNKAEALLNKIPQHSAQSLLLINKTKYLLCKQQENYADALKHLEEYSLLKDSFFISSNESKILEIENRYKHQKLMTENAELRLRQTGYLLACAVCLIVVLAMLWAYFGYRKRTEKKLLLQQADIRDTRNRLLELSIEMERKNALLKHSEEEEKELERMREEMETLTARYRTLRENMLESSPAYKKLHQLAKQRKPQNTRTLISEELWEQIKQQAQKIYPDLRRYVIDCCPDLSESEWAYCCLYMFGFDTNDEASLLGINPSSVRTKTLRLRTRLNIDLPAQMSLYEYITMQI